MNKRLIYLISILFLLSIAGALLASCGSGSSSAPATSSPVVSVSQGQELMQARCSGCHSTNRITSAKKTVDEWGATVDRMINKGAQLNAEEQQILIDYLAENYK